MKKTILSFAAALIFGFAAISCASHTSYRSYSDGQSLQPNGQWEKCAVCQGKGSCGSCKGTGRISGDKCSACNGSGRCRTCNGNGGYMVSE